jgi:hypothetical protein
MRAILILRVAGTIILGMIIRALRRLARRRPRIWRGPRPLHVTADLVRSDRLAGYPSRSLVDDAKLHSYALVTAEDFDRVLSLERHPRDTYHWRAMMDLHLRGDIWAAHFDSGFFPDAQATRNRFALRLCRFAGIRIVVAPHGSDIIRNDRQPARSRWIDRMQHDYPAWDFNEQTAVTRARLELFETAADFVLAADIATRSLMDRIDLLFHYFAVPLPAEYRHPSNPVPRVAHAPNHRFVKGTDLLLEAVAQVRAKGFELELDLIERVPRTEALLRYEEADIIADQFRIGDTGVLALEGMSRARPVLAYLSPEHLQEPSLNLPVINTTERNITEVLAVLIASPTLRRRIGDASRTAVANYQSLVSIGEVWSRIYDHVWERRELDLSGTAYFSPERRARPLTDDPADPEFWPVNVADLLTEIQSAVDRVRR